MFSEEEFDSDIEHDESTPTNLATNFQVAVVTEKEKDIRHRTSSTGSEQIGRFEVSQNFFDCHVSGHALTQPQCWFSYILLSFPVEAIP